MAVFKHTPSRMRAKYFFAFYASPHSSILDRFPALWDQDNDLLSMTSDSHVCYGR
jgi:hypothetical protein